MVCACFLLFQTTYLAIVIGYPLKCLYILDKENKTDKKWIYYFFIMTVFTILENTILFPIKWLLNKIDFCMFLTLKALLALLLYCPEANLIEKIEQIIGPHIDTAYLKLNPILGKHLEKIGITNKDIAGSSKRME